MSKKTVLSASKKKPQSPKLVTIVELHSLIENNKARIMPLVTRIDVLPDLLPLRTRLFNLMDLIASDTYSGDKVFYLENTALKHKIETEIITPLDEIEEQIAEMEKLRTQEIYKLKLKPPKKEDLDKIEDGLNLTTAFEFVEDVVKYKDNSIKGKGNTPPSEDIDEVFNSFARLNKLKEAAKKNNTQEVVDAMVNRAKNIKVENKMLYVNRDKVSDKVFIGAEEYSAEEAEKNIIPPQLEFEGKEWLDAHTRKRNPVDKQPDFMDLTKTIEQKGTKEESIEKVRQALNKPVTDTHDIKGVLAGKDHPYHKFLNPEGYQGKQGTSWVNNPEHQIMKEIKGDNTEILIDCLKDIEILEGILLSKVDCGGIAKDKIKELITPLYRHALLVLGFSVSRGLVAPSPDNDVFKQSEMDMVGTSATILKKLETLYTNDFMTGVVSVGRVHEILTPLKRHVNFIMGIYSIAEREKERNNLAYIKMASLPSKGETFSQAIECSEDGTPITTHHYIEIVNKFTGDDQQSFVEFKSKFHGSGGGRIYRDQILKYWKFIK